MNTLIRKTLLEAAANPCCAQLLESVLTANGKISRSKWNPAIFCIGIRLNRNKLSVEGYDLKSGYYYECWSHHVLTERYHHIKKEVETRQKDK